MGLLPSWQQAVAWVSDDVMGPRATVLSYRYYSNCVEITKGVFLPCWCKDRYIDRFAQWLVYLLIEVSSIDRLIGIVDRLIEFAGRLSSLIDQLTAKLFDILTDCLTDWQTDRLTAWLTASPTNLFADSLTGWLNGWIINWSASRLVGLLINRSCFFVFCFVLFFLLLFCCCVVAVFFVLFLFFFRIAMPRGWGRCRSGALWNSRSLDSILAENNWISDRSMCGVNSWCATAWRLTLGVMIADMRTQHT